MSLLPFLTSLLPVQTELPFLPPQPDFELAGAAFFEETGAAVRAAGDVNGDGVDDLLVLSPGAPQLSGVHGRGRLDLHLGTPDGFEVQPAWTVRGVDFLEAPDIDAIGLGDVNGDTFDDIAIAGTASAQSQPVGAVYVFYGGPSGPTGALLTDADWIARGELPTTVGFGSSIAGPGDVTDNGYPDLVVGCDLFENASLTHNDEGAVFLFEGGPAGFASSGPVATIADAIWSVEGNETGLRLGIAVQAVGDVNGDALADFAITSRGTPGGGTLTQHWIVRGAPGGPATGLPVGPWTFGGVDRNARMGYDLAAADFDGDGRSDVVAAYPGVIADGEPDRIEFFYGRDWGLQPTGWSAGPVALPEGRGSSMVAGDFNGDARIDLAVASSFWTEPGQPTNVGRVRVYPGSSPLGGVPLDPAPADWEFVPEHAQAGQGLMVDDVGDPDGDGATTLGIGVPRETVAGTFAAGRAWLFSGEAEEPDPCPIAAPDWRFTGETLERIGDEATVGDFNGDGFDDAIVARGWTQQGAGDLYVFHGGPQGLSNAPVRTITLDGVPTVSDLAPVSSGDVNGDGFDDVLVLHRGEWYFPLSGWTTGEAYLFLGGPNGLGATADWVARDSVQNLPTHFARTGAIVGDLNGDGFDEIAIGAFGHDNLFGFNDPFDVPGRVFLWAGSSSGWSGEALSAQADWQLLHSDSSGFFGWNLGTPGDLDGDGFDELFVSAPFLDLDDGTAGAGAVYLWKGSAQGPVINPFGSEGTAHWSMTGQIDGDYVGLEWRFGDLDGDGRQDWIQRRGLYEERRLEIRPGQALGFGSVDQVLQRTDRKGFGEGFAVVPDFDGDGRADLAVTSPSATARAPFDGRIDLFRTTPAGDVLEAATWRSAGDRVRVHLGNFGLLEAADFNGDGRSDLLSGSPHWYEQTEIEQRGYVAAWYGTDRTLLEATPNPATAGEDVTIGHLGGLPGSPVALFATRFEQIPILPATAGLLGLGVIDDDGCWLLDLTLPPSVPLGLWTLQTLAIEQDFGVRVSEEEELQIGS